jgi:hypothetical protein
MQRVFDLIEGIKISRDDSYIVSYPHLISYAEGIQTFSVADLVRLAHMSYGWMPTILNLYHDDENISLSDGASLLQKARGEEVSELEIFNLARLVNNSLVGASKLLHFCAPDRYAIWDSKIYSFVHNKKPYNYRVNEVELYPKYLKGLELVKHDPRFQNFHAAVNEKVGYEVSAFRAIELVMYKSAPVFGG